MRRTRRAVASRQLSACAALFLASPPGELTHAHREEHSSLALPRMRSLSVRMRPAAFRLLVAEALLGREGGRRVEPRAGRAEEPPLPPWCFISPPTVRG